MTATLAEARGFRADINGLRALGMIPLVVGHFDRRILPGFALWVDVFFVLSGYLMTGIVRRALERNQFTFAGFYAARIRRILPPLVVMGAVTTIVGGLVLDPWAWQALATDVPAAMLLVSNLVYAGRLGYFAPAAESQWMLPTWSLGVEAQFYLVIPVLLWALHASPLKSRQALALGLVALLSFSAGVLAADGHANALYYDAPTRLWQLLVGGICAQVETHWRPGSRVARLIHGAGLAILIACSLWLGPLASWPSAWAAAPVFGVALVLIAGVTHPPWATSPVVARIGLASYSIYIWHWPIILALRYAEVPLSPLVIGAGSLVCLAAGLLSYAVIETRLTPALWRSGAARGALAVAGLVAATSALAWGVAVAQGFEAARMRGRPVAVRQALADDRLAASDWTYPGLCGRMESDGGVSVCRIGDPKARRLLVIGDSQAEQLAPRLAGRAFGPGEGVTFVTRGGCPILPGVSVSPRVARCAGWSVAAWALAERETWDRVVIASGWMDYLDPKTDAVGGRGCFEAAGECRSPEDPAARTTAETAAFRALAAQCRRLRALGRDVVLIGQNPTMDVADPHRLYKLAYWAGAVDPPPAPPSDSPDLLAEGRRRLGEVARQSGARLIEPMSSLCSGGLCALTEHGRALYKDRRHFRASFLAGDRFAYLDSALTLPIRSAASPPQAASPTRSLNRPR